MILFQCLRPILQNTYSLDLILCHDLTQFYDMKRYFQLHAHLCFLWAYWMCLMSFYIICWLQLKLADVLVMALVYFGSDTGPCLRTFRAIQSVPFPFC